MGLKRTIIRRRQYFVFIPPSFFVSKTSTQGPKLSRNYLTSPASAASLVRPAPASAPPAVLKSSAPSLVAASPPSLVAGALLLLLRQGRQRLPRRAPVLAYDGHAADAPLHESGPRREGAGGYYAREEEEYPHCSHHLVTLFIPLSFRHTRACA